MNSVRRKTSPNINGVRSPNPESSSQAIQPSDFFRFRHYSKFDGSGSCFTTIGRLIVFRRDAKPMNLTSHPPAIFFQSRKCMHASLASRPKKMHANPLGPSLALASYKANNRSFEIFDFVTTGATDGKFWSGGFMFRPTEAEVVLPPLGGS